MPMNDFQIWFCAPSVCSSSSSSGSVRGGGSWSARWRRISGGTTSSMSLSSEGTPSTRSISATSSGRGPIWRAGNWSGGVRSIGMKRNLRGRYESLGLLTQERLIALRIHEVLGLVGVRESDLDHPALVVRVLIDVLGRITERAIGLD